MSNWKRLDYQLVTQVLLMLCMGMVCRVTVFRHLTFCYLENFAQLTSFHYICNSYPSVMKNLLMIVFVFAMLVSCGRKTAGSILPEGCKLRAGDLVFRRGNGLTSRVVMVADRHGSYSHVGIVVDSCGVMMVVHAVPGEPDYEGDPDRVKMETPEKFYSSINAKIGEVKRLRGDTAAAACAARYALDAYRRGVLFDHDYDDGDSTRMYCCELVERAYASAGRPLASGARHTIHLPGVRIECILPSDICNNAALETVILF